MIGRLPPPPAPDEDDEATEAPPPDPNDDPTHPLHGLAVTYFETIDPSRRGFVPILAVAFDERDVGFLEAVSRYSEEPSEQDGREKEEHDRLAAPRGRGEDGEGHRQAR